MRAAAAHAHALRLELAGLCILALLTYLFLWRLWAAEPQERATFPEKSDTTEVFFPPRLFAARTLRAGEWPLWNPHVYSGYPQFADPQAATFYPPQLILALAAGSAFSLDTMALSAALHFWLAGSFTFLFLRRQSLGVLPALLGGAAFEFGGYLTGFAPLQFSELEAAAWLPGTLLVLAWAMERPRLSHMALAGLVFSLVFLAGRPQSYLTIAPVCLGWLLFEARRRGWTWRATGQHVGVFGLAALGGASVQWLPTLELTRLSTRAEVLYASVAHGGFAVQELAGLLHPALADSTPIYETLYVGTLTLACAALAVARRQGLFWAGLGTAFLLLALGQRLVTLDALYLVQRLGFPGYLRDVERLALGVNFCVAVLGATGLDELRREAGALPRAAVLAAGGVLSVTVTVAALRLLAGPEPASAAAAYQAALYVGLLLGAAALSVWVAGPRRRAAQLSLLVLASVDVMSLNHGRFWVVDQKPMAREIEHVAAAPPGYQTFYRISADQLTSQDFGSVLGVDGWWGLPPLTLRSYQSLINGLDSYRRNILLNVNVVATSGVYADPAYQLVAEWEDFRYYYFLHAHARAYLVQYVQFASDPADALAQVSDAAFDHWNASIIQGKLALDSTAPLGANEWAEVVRRTANRLEIDVQTEAPRFLVIANAHYPGWRATIDGQTQPLLITNAALQGLAVPAGRHLVTLRFLPWTFIAGLAVSLVVWLGAAIWAALARARRRPTRGLVA